MEWSLKLEPQINKGLPHWNIFDRPILHHVLSINTIQNFNDIVIQISSWFHCNINFNTSELLFITLMYSLVYLMHIFCQTQQQTCFWSSEMQRSRCSGLRNTSSTILQIILLLSKFKIGRWTFQYFDLYKKEMKVNKSKSNRKIIYTDF
jgi:hypothetical protein